MGLGVVGWSRCKIYSNLRVDHTAGAPARALKSKRTGSASASTSAMLKLRVRFAWQIRVEG